MNRDQKTAVVEQIAGQIKAADAIFAVDYRGLSVAQAAELRGRLCDVDATFRIVKNSLTERAADQAGAEDLKPLLVGPTALTLVHGDAALAAKALNDTARRLNLLEFKGGLLNGSVLSAADVRSIARLPAREILQGQLVATIAAPLSGLVRGLNALISGLAIQLKAIADMDPPVLVGGGAAPASEPVVSEPADSEPVVSEPAVSESAVSESAVSESAVSEPADKEAADSEPTDGGGSPAAAADPAAPEPEAQVQAPATATEPEAPVEPEAQVQAPATATEPEAQVETPAEAEREPAQPSEQDTASDADPSDE